MNDGLAWLGQLQPDAQNLLHGAVTEYLKLDSLADYRPYPKQALFHVAGFRYPSRMLIAGNQQGKTFSAGMEMAMHLTGEYPVWWRGRRFTDPIVGWAAGESGEETRDTVQTILLGPPDREGTGTIPERCLTKMCGRARGVSGLYDYIRIKHVSGGTSLLRFKHYAQKREAWQGSTVHVVWFDEEPPEDKYTEGLARTIATDGISMLTATPMKGMSVVVMMYYSEKGRGVDRHLTTMILDDALHVKPEARQAHIEKFPEHEREARIYAKPMMGEGLIFPVMEAEIVCAPFEIPEWWPRIAGIDIGMDHPTAGVMLALDRDGDVVYVCREYRVRRKTPDQHTLTLKHWGKHLKWAWPSDAHQSEKATGARMADLYRAEGLKFMRQHSQYQATQREKNAQRSTVSVERGLVDMLQRMTTARFKVFDTCAMWLEERRLYHRKGGKVVKEQDDLMDATRIAIMSLRFAEVPAPPTQLRRPPPDWQSM